MQVRHASVDEAEALRDLHDESIRGLCLAEYSTAEIAAWAAPKSVEAYATAIAKEVFLVAELGGCVIGFGALAIDDAEVQAVYVAPSHARRGVGSAILRELERVARERGIRQLGLKSSLTAEPFYRAQQYEATGYCTHQTGDQALTCVCTQKTL